MNNELSLLWDRVLAGMQATLPAQSFEIWFKNTRIATEVGTTVIVAVPNGFAKEWLDVKYRSMILALLCSHRANISDVSFVVA